MPALTFDINKNGLTDVLPEETPLKDFMERVLSDDAESALKEITPWLLEFHKHDGGSPEISGLRITDCSNDLAAHSGKVTFSYKVSFTFGCAGIFRTDDYTETCKFRIDTENKKLILFITDHITRDTVDEF